MSSDQGMKALILVGGYGTRLRPLTFSTPKPLVPFCNKPMIIHQIQALKEVGVTDIVLAIAYRPELMKDEMDKWGKEIGVRFIYSHETEPLGTAGPIALAKKYLKDENLNNLPFFVLNSDVTCKFPLKEMLDFHIKNKAEGTILVTKVTDWSKYGVIVYDEKSGQIDQFVEKPKTFVGDKINAGIYVLNPEIINRIPLQKTSIETQVFPFVAKDKKLFAFELEGFWMDIGQPHDYISGLGKYLHALSENSARKKELITEEEAKKRGFTIIGDVMIDSTAKIGAGAVLGPNVSIDKNTTIGECARLINTAIFEDSIVKKGAYLNSTIVGWKSEVGCWCRCINNTVLGEDVQVKDEIYLNGVKVLPNKGVGVSYDKPEIIM